MFPGLVARFSAILTIACHAVRWLRGTRVPIMGKTPDELGGRGKPMGQAGELRPRGPQPSSVESEHNVLFAETTMSGM
jgi:hypothetical protein